MSVPGGSDSAVKQSTQNAPLSASDQAVILSLRGSSVLGDKNSGNSTIRIARGGTYNPSVTYTTQGYSREDLDTITSSFNQSVSAALTGLGQQRQLDAGRDLPDIIEDRLGGQITNAPEEAAKQKRTFLILVVAMLAIAGGALFLGEKKVAMIRSYMRLIDFRIPAGANQPFGAPGSLVVIKDASAPFDLAFDDDGSSTVDGGFTVDTGEDRFGKIHISNRSTSDVLTGQLFVGKGSGKAGVSYSYERVRPTITNASNSTAQAVGNLETFPGVVNGLRRAHISIFNHSTTATDILWIRAPYLGTQAYFMCAEVRPGIPIKLETDVTLQIFSATGSAFTYSFVEVFTR